jgi:hypothetical protein
LHLRGRRIFAILAERPLYRKVAATEAQASALPKKRFAPLGSGDGVCRRSILCCSEPAIAKLTIGGKTDR